MFEKVVYNNVIKTEKICFLTFNLGSGKNVKQKLVIFVHIHYIKKYNSLAILYDVSKVSMLYKI